VDEFQAEQHPPNAWADQFQGEGGIAESWAEDFASNSQHPAPAGPPGEQGYNMAADNPFLSVTSPSNDHFPPLAQPALLLRQQLMGTHAVLALHHVAFACCGLLKGLLHELQSVRCVQCRGFKFTVSALELPHWIPFD